jgi:hypothetical protein
MTRARLLVVSVALAASPSGALAAPPPQTLAVIAVGDAPVGPGPELAELARTFRGSVAATTSGVLTADELRQRMEGRASSSSLGELDRAYTGAVAAFQAGDYERASRTLRAIVDDLERLPPSDQVFAQWSRSMMRLARSEGSLGRRAEAREVMERLLRADSAASPDPELYPPSFARQIDEVRAELRAKARRKLAVTAGGAPARVYVDGRYAGDAPVTVTVAPGKYRVAGVLRSVTSAPALADLSTEDQTVALDFSVAETLRPTAGPGLAAPTAAGRRATAIVSAGAFLKLDRVYAISLAVDGDVHYLVGSVYEVAKGSLLREGRVRVGGGAPAQASMTALATFLQTGEPSTLVLTRPDAAAKPAPIAIAPEEPRASGGQGGSSALLKWSPVATAGLAVVLGGFALYENGQAKSKYDSAKGLLNSSGALAESDRSRYGSLLSDGDGAKRNATIGAVGAGVALVGTGVLSYISYKKTGEVGPFRF